MSPCSETTAEYGARSELLLKTALNSPVPLNAKTERPSAFTHNANAFAALAYYPKSVPESALFGL